MNKQGEPGAVTDEQAKEGVKLQAKTVLVILFPILLAIVLGTMFIGLLK